MRPTKKQLNGSNKPDGPAGKLAAKDAPKRKRAAEKTDTAPKKRQRVTDARLIAVQSSGQAFKNGEIDVQKYLRAREFEVHALEECLSRAKKGLNSRAFQLLPRDLRRRTASHNVKRVPRRLRGRAAKEVC